MRSHSYTLLLFIAVVATPRLWAGPVIQWQRHCFDSRYFLTPAQVCLTHDGAYMVAGTGGNGHDSIVCTRVDSGGNLIWRKTYDTYDSSFIHGYRIHEVTSCRALSDGGFALAGWRSLSLQTPDKDAWVLRLDSAGAVLWKKEFGPPGYLSDTASEAWHIQEAKNKDLLVAGQRRYSSWVCRLDPRGATIWSNRYAGRIARSLTEFPDGRILAVGDSIHATDGGGKTLWSVDYGDEMNAFAKAVMQSRSGDIVIVGETGAFSIAIGKYVATSIVSRIDADGTTVWKKLYCCNATGYDALETIIEMPDSGYLMAGSRSSFTGAPRLWLVRTDPSGDTVWTHAYASSSSSSSLVAAPDRGFAVAVAESNPGSASRIELVKMTERVETSIGWSGSENGNCAPPGELRIAENRRLFFDLRGRLVRRLPAMQTPADHRALGLGAYVVLHDANSRAHDGTMIIFDVER